MIKKSSPLNWMAPIVDKDGRPTPEFIRHLQQLAGNDTTLNKDVVDLTSVTDAAAVEALKARNRVGPDGQDGLDGQDGISIVGPTGPIGPQGRTGQDGLDGEDGVTIPGPAGAAGSAGATGATGATGSQGPAGFGLDGVDGEEGMPIPGVAGAAGATGATGTTGPAGAAGAIGIGLDGEPGEDGMPIPGAAGVAGAVGAAGTAGATGAQGPMGFGLDGQDGEEGIRIPGPTGATGATGVIGPQGPIGFGLDGVDGEEGMPIPGASGANGSNGATGATGTSGGGTITLDVKYADAGNTTTTETDIFTYTTAVNRLATNGDRIQTQGAGVFVSSGTATRQMRMYFGGTLIFDSGALTVYLAAAWVVTSTITRVSGTVIRYEVSMTTEGAALAAYTASGEVTGLTLSNTNIIKITGTAAGVGAATNDIVGKAWSVDFLPFNAGAVNYGFSPPRAADFTLFSGDAGAAVLTDDSDVGLVLTATTAVNTAILRGGYKTLPAVGTDFSVIAKIVLNCQYGAQFTWGGLTMYESATGKSHNFFIPNDAASAPFHLRRQTIAGVFTSEVTVGFNYTLAAWFKMDRVGTTLGFYTSSDGKNWHNIQSIAQTTFLTTAPDRIGPSMLLSHATLKPIVSVPYWAQTGF